jgi:hypothetical protein
MRAATRERNGRKGTKPRGPAPLAVWARREADAPPPIPAVNGVPHANGSTELPETSAILGGLNLPPTVAAVRYAGGCRIGKVKVKSASRKRQPKAKGARRTAGKGKKEAAEPLIILSRKVLDQVRGT